jgi:hypothetical protein
VAFESAWICSWICHYYWQVQIAAKAANAEGPGVVEHDTMRLEEPDAWKLASMELDNDPDAMEPNVGSEVLYHILLA